MSPRLARFGPFEFDPQSLELRKNGYRVRLTASQLRLLRLFLERPGELVTREAIADCLWEGSRTVEVKVGINTAMKRLREALDESRADSPCLETVIGLGYRFVAPVRFEMDRRAPPPVVENGAPVAEDRAAAGEVGDVTNLQTQSLLARSSSSLPGMPGASESGVSGLIAPDGFASGSVDGPSVSASWGKRALAACLVLMTLGSFAVVFRLRSPAAGTVAPVRRDFRFEPITFDESGNVVTAAAVSPDGSSVAYADATGLLIHYFDGRPEATLDPDPGLQVDHVAWYPNNTDILFSGFDRVRGDNEVVLSNGPTYTKPLLTDAALATVAPDGSRIAFTRDHGQALWLASADGTGEHRLFRATPGQPIRFLLWSRDGRSLLCSGPVDAEVSSTAKWSGAYAAGPGFFGTVDALTGKVIWWGPGPLIESGYLSAGANGTRLIFLGRVSSAVGMNAPLRLGLLETGFDPKSGMLTGHPWMSHALAGDSARSLSGSLDGRRISAVLEKRAEEIYIASVQQHGAALTDVTQFTHGVIDSYPHTWLADDSLAFESVLDGRDALFTQRMDSLRAKLLVQVPGEAIYPQRSPDGKWILFIETRGAPQVRRLFRVPLAGGTPELVPTTGQVADFHCPSAMVGHCVLEKVLSGEALVFYRLDPITGQGPELARIAWRPDQLGDWNLSPDGSAIGMANHSTASPGVDIVRLSDPAHKIQHIPVLNHGIVLGLSWMPDQSGLYLECKLGTQRQLLHADFAGHTELLRESPLAIYAVPSPDGKKIAFPSVTNSANVWASFP